MIKSWPLMEQTMRSKVVNKVFIILSCFAIQGCLVEFNPRSPRPRPDEPCQHNRHCPGDSYCEIDGYCYENPFYTECSSDRECPLGTYCGPNGLCYEEYDHHGQCYTHSDCAVDYYCSASGLCYYLH